MKKLLIVLFSLLLLTACAGTKTVTDKAEAKKMAEEFYDELLASDPIMMNSYFDDKLSTVFAKDKDKMYVDQIEAGYDYYMFMENGKKYLISSDRTLMEDESMYDLSLNTIDMTLKMNVLGYFDVEDDSVKLSVTNNNDTEFVLTVDGKAADGSSFTVTSTGLKDDAGQVTEIRNEIKSGDTTQKMSYMFTYDNPVELPEYTIPVTYDNMPHVDSPYKTVGDIIKTLNPVEQLSYSFINDELIIIKNVNDKYYQLSAPIDQVLMDQYNSIDFMADDYDKQIYDLISGIEIKDCIDFTDAVLSKDVLASYNGKTIGDLVNDGFEVNGWAFGENEYYVYAVKDLLDYKVEVIPVEGFDFDAEFEYSDFNDFAVKNIVFENVETAALPMR